MCLINRKYEYGFTRVVTMHPISKSSNYSSLSSSQPFARSIALFHMRHLSSRCVTCTAGLNVVFPCSLTLESVSGFEISHPYKPIAEPAKRAEPSAVDLSPIWSPSISWKKLSTHSRIFGLKISIPTTSDSICIAASPFVIPPSTFNVFASGWCFASRCMLSRIARV